MLTTAEGMPVSWCLTNPKLGEREVMTALLERDHHLGRSGQVILADKGFAGRDFEALLTERLGVHLVRPDRKNEPVRHGRPARVRQWIESVFDTLKGQLSWNSTAAEPPPASSPEPANVSSLWPPASGTTGPPVPRSNDLSLPTTTENIGLIHLGRKP